MEPELHWLIFGAGAIGTYIGGSLALNASKQRVVFVDRPTVVEEVQQRGLHLAFPAKELVLSSPEIYGSIEAALAAGPYDIAIFGVKSYDTQSAIQSLEPFKGSMPPFLCLQNGVENELALSSVLGMERVIAGTVTSSIGRRSAGDVVIERLRGVGVASGHPLSHKLVEAMNRAGLNASLFNNPVSMKWSKLLTNVLANATSAILDMPPAEIFTHKGLFNLEVEQLREVLAVMKAHNIPVVNLPGTPVYFLAIGARFLPSLLLYPLLKKAAGSGRGGKMPSFHIDLHSGRGVSEVDYLNGAVVRYGEKVNIPTPVNRKLNEILQSLSKGKIPLETYAHQPERLIKEIS